MIGKALKYMRKQKGITQENMAKIINVKQNTLSNYETEEISIDFSMIEKIANICDYGIYFFNKKKNEKWKVQNLERKDI